LNPDFNVVRV
jgi:hypothetical protein